MKRTLILLTAMLISYATSAETIVYSVDGKPYEGHWSKAKDDAPLVILVHDWDGLTDYEIKRAAMLNELGYNVFAADLFGQGVRPTKLEDKRQHTGQLYKDREKLRRLMNASRVKAVELAGHDENIVVMGYCFGGAAVLESARAGMAAKGFVTFHGGLQTPQGQSYNQTKAPILILHGTADSAITMSQFATLATELEQAKVPHQMVTYSGAPHAFTVFGSDRYRKDADTKSWRTFQQFLEERTQ